MQYEAAKPKGVSRNEDAPKQEPMRGSDSQVRRNPSTDQKKVRRQMAKKSAYDIFFANSKIAVRGSCINCGTNMLVPEDSSFPKCDNCTKNDPAVGTPDRPYDREKDPGFTGSRKTAFEKLVECPDCSYKGRYEEFDNGWNDVCPKCGELFTVTASSRAQPTNRKTAENENPWRPKLPTWTQIHGLQHGESVQFIGPDGVEHNISYHEHVPDNDFGNKAYGYKAGVFTVEGPKGTQYHRVSPFQEHETSQKRYAADDVYHTMMRNFRGPQIEASRKTAADTQPGLENHLTYEHGFDFDPRDMQASNWIDFLRDLHVHDHEGLSDHDHGVGPDDENAVRFYTASRKTASLDPEDCVWCKRPGHNNGEHKKTPDPNCDMCQYKAHNNGEHEDTQDANCYACHGDAHKNGEHDETPNSKCDWCQLDTHENGHSEINTTGSRKKASENTCKAPNCNKPTVPGPYGYDNYCLDCGADDFGYKHEDGRNLCMPCGEDYQWHRLKDEPGSWIDRAELDDMEVEEGKPIKCEDCGDNLRGPDTGPNPLLTQASNKNATLIPTQVQNLTPQDYILHPITQGNEKIRRARSFETRGDEAYVETDSGTSSPVKRNQTIVRNPYNMSQIELPSTGIPGGNSNVIPFGRQHDPIANKPSAKESKCPRDGTMMTLQKGGNTYKCSTCGLVETVRGAGGLNFSDAPSVNKAAIKNNRRTASAIAQRARQVLDLEENQ